MCNQYDYGARFYDPAIARWTSPDLLTELHHDVTSYNYVLNNPVNYTDPMGLDTVKSNAPPGSVKAGDVVRYDDGTAIKVNQPDFIIQGNTASKPSNTPSTPSNIPSTSNNDNNGNNAVQITFGPGANRDAVTDYTRGVLRDVMIASA